MLNPSIGGPFSHFRGRARCFPYVSIDDMVSDKHSAGVLVNLFQPERDIPIQGSHSIRAGEEAAKPSPPITGGNDDCK
jgi:hypothetical protein